MFLLSELVALEQTGLTGPGAWARVELLSKALRQHWLSCSRPLDLGETVLRMTAGLIGDQAFLVVATQSGRIGLLQLMGDELHVRAWLRLSQFDPGSDELRNLLLAPRRLSAEWDLYISVRSWPVGASKEATARMWRAAITLDSDGQLQLRCVPEGTAATGHSWTEVPSAPPLDPVYLEPVLQCAAGLDVFAAVETRTERVTAHPQIEHLAISEEGEVAYRSDGRLIWHRPLQDGGIEHRVWEPAAIPVALCLDHSARFLVMALDNGQLELHTDGQPANEDLDVGVSALAALPRQAGPEFLLAIASLDGRIGLRSHVGRQRLLDCWQIVVAHCCRQFQTVEAWRAWTADEECPGPSIKVRQLLLLHMAWQSRDEALFESLGALARRPDKHRPGTRLGVHLADLLTHQRLDAQLSKLALNLYDSGGLAIREQVDRARLPALPGELRKRSVRNCWDTATDPSDTANYRSAIGNVATRPYLFEVAWRGVARHVGCLGRRLIIARPSRAPGVAGVASLALPQATAIAMGVRKEEDPFESFPALDSAEDASPESSGLRVRWLRSLHTGRHRPAVALGTSSGVRLLLATAEAPELLDIPNDIQNARAGGLPTLLWTDPQPNFLQLGLPWPEGARVWLDDTTLTQDPTGHWSLSARREAVPVPATALDGIELGSGERWLAAGTRAPRLHWLRRDASTGTWTEQAQQTLDSPVVQLRFVRGRGQHAETPLLLLTTQAGRIWCIDARDRSVRWCHATSGTITALDFVGQGEDLHIAICSSPHWLTLLDGQGRRVWRHRVGGCPNDLVLVGSGSGPPERIAVLHDGDHLSLYWRSDREHWLQEAKALPALDTDGDRLHVARALAEQCFDWDHVQAIRKLEPRRALLAAAMQHPTRWPPLLDLPDLLLADVAAMVRELPPPHAIADWERLWLRALPLLRTSGERYAQAELLMSLWMAMRATRPPFDYVARRLTEWRDELGIAETERLLHTHPEIAVQIAHVCSEALAGPPGRVSSDRLMRELHLLPPAVARQLHLFHSEASHAVQMLHLLAPSEGEMAPTLSRADAQAPLDDADHCLANALHAAHVLWSRPEWPQALNFLRRCSAVTPGAGPLVALLRAPLLAMPAGEWAADEMRLDKQERWLATVLGQRWSMPLDLERGWVGWIDVLQGLLRQAEQAFRSAALARLTEVVARSRPRLDARILHWIGDQVHLGLSVSHEGKLVLDRPEILVQVWWSGRSQPLATSWQATPMRLAPEDPPLLGRLRVRVPAGARELHLRMSCRAAGREEDISDWPLPLDRPSKTSENSPSLLLSTSWRATLEQDLREMRSSVGILVLDTVLQPASVVHSLSELPNTDLVDLDRALADLGPGRTYPQALDLQAILRAIEGQDPRDAQRVFDADTWISSAARPAARVLIAPCSDTTARLLEPGLRATLDTLWAGLRRRLKRPGLPQWVWVLPGETAAIWHAALLSEGVGWLHPAHLEETRCTNSHLADLARAIQMDMAQARLAWLRAGSDLRALGTSEDPRDPARLGWLRADLAGLQPAELMATLALGGAMCRVPLNKLPKEAISAENVVSEVQVSSNQPKTLIRRGDPVDDPSRLLPVRKQLLVRGLQRADVLEDVEPGARRLLEACGFDARMLVRLHGLGLVRKLEPRLYVLRSDLQRWMHLWRDRGHEWGEALNVLGNEASGLQALSLRQLRHADESLLSLLRGEGQSLPYSLVQAIGRLWAEARVSTSTAQSLIQALVGASPETPIQSLATASQQALVPINDWPRFSHLCCCFVAEADASLSWPAVPEHTLLLAAGPIADRLPALPGILRLGETQVREILRSSDPRRTFWTSMHAQMDMDLLSPFHHNAALPPGSPMFVGRSKIRAQIRQGLRERSFLILGARQVGKTSLLHQVLEDARARTDVYCLKLDAQGIDEASAFALALRGALDMPQASTDAAGLQALLDVFERVAAETQPGCMPVLMVNEIDGLLQHAPQLIQQLRARHEAQRMRFVFVGYTPALWALEDIESPLFHFTSGQDDRAFVLGPLETEDCRQLLAKLTAEPLALQWVDAKHRAVGEDLLIEASWRVPWVLQDLCHALVLRMHGERRTLLELEDVRQVLARRPAFLERLERFDLASAMRGQTKHNENEARTGGRLLLLLLASERYRDLQKNSSWADIAARDARTLAFTAADAIELWHAGLRRLPLLDRERDRMVAWIRRVPLESFLSALTLSLILAPTRSGAGEYAWFFQSHIYPMELYKDAERRHRSLDDRILEYAKDLWGLLAAPRERDEGTGHD